ncbi:hypothetical protein MMC13_001166 [Lambiella insularis]|nr:hypothetical protein [Lambiella insularis]
MKAVLLGGLPPIFRIVEKLGLSLPRRFFKQASEYDNVPSHLKTDNVIPSVYEIPNLLASIRHPRHSRSVSIGPQSQADAYEVLAFRQKRRRESLSSSAAVSSGEEQKIMHDANSTTSSQHVKSFRQMNGMPAGSHRHTRNVPNPDIARHRQWSDSAILAPSPGESAQQSRGILRTPSQVRKQDEKEEKEMFSKLEKPRVRYDVEVITKLVVYSGIAWLAVEGNPILFHYLGLGIYGNSG